MVSVITRGTAKPLMMDSRTPWGKTPALLQVDGKFYGQKETHLSPIPALLWPK